MSQLVYKCINSLVGKLTLVAHDKKLVAILWDNEKPNRVKLDEIREEKDNLFLLEVETQLSEYFCHKRRSFNLPLQLDGTDFQRAVWQELFHIPYGATSSYKEIAKKIGRPKAVRAVGTAIGRNPVSLVIPCHRVIATDGQLAGFAGGLERKKALLELEAMV